MLTTNDIAPVLIEVGEGLLVDLLNAQSQRGLKASGYSARNTRSVVEIDAKTITLSLIGPAYWKNQDRGRGPNRRKGRPSTAFVQTIREWIQIKGLSIPLSAAGAIAYKIVNTGIQVPNPHNPGGVLSETLQPARIGAEIKTALRSKLVSNIRAQLFA